MSPHRQKTGGSLGERRGAPVYESNPSVPTSGEIVRSKPKALGSPQKGFVVDGAGEILGQGVAYTYELEEVDKERFVKLFLSGLRQATGLSKTGLLLFEAVYQIMREKPNSDKIEFGFYHASQYIPDLTLRTYQRGLRELLEQEFLFNSPLDGVFFVNIRFMFNGDRLAFVKAYQLKNNKKPPENAAALLGDENRRVG